MRNIKTISCCPNCYEGYTWDFRYNWKSQRGLNVRKCKKCGTSIEEYYKLTQKKDKLIIKIKVELIKENDIEVFIHEV